MARPTKSNIIFTITIVLIFAVPQLWGQFPTIPKKYDPSTIENLQVAITKISTEVNSLRTQISTTNKNNNNLVLRVNALSLSLQALQVEVGNLDVKQNADRITRLEDRNKEEDERAAYLETLCKYILSGVGVLLLNLFARWIKDRNKDSKIDEIHQEQIKVREKLEEKEKI